MLVVCIQKEKKLKPYTVQKMYISRNDGTFIAMWDAIEQLKKQV